MQETEWQDVTLHTPVYLIQRYTEREVVPYLSHSMESILHYVLYGFDCAQLCGNVRCKHSCYFTYLLPNHQTYCNIIGFSIRKWFGYRKGKTRPCLCAAWSYEIPLFQRFSTLIISLVEVSHAGVTRLIRVLFCLYNARIRPSIFRLGDGSLGAFRRRAGCCQGVFTQMYSAVLIYSDVEDQLL